jgi:hypothetical protein
MDETKVYCEQCGAICVIEGDLQKNAGYCCDCNDYVSGDEVVKKDDFEKIIIVWPDGAEP